MLVDGMVINFKSLSFIQEWLDEHFDHALILGRADPLGDALRNDIPEAAKPYKLHIMDGEPTAENMAKLIGCMISRGLREMYSDCQPRASEVKLGSVTVWETAKCRATWQPGG
jgi:6-pyruvoyl-tetrahydropterin synthase